MITGMLFSYFTAVDHHTKFYHFKKNIIPRLIAFTSLFIFATFAAAASNGLQIKDYTQRLNSRFKKERRLSTRYIIIHTSEAGLESTLRTLSKGKKTGTNYRTIGGHAHYTIARNGQVYRLLNHRYRADHAGLSMWKGIEDISSHSLGIELVGYHYGEITTRQYSSLTLLIDQLQKIYHIPDKNVLTHSQVSYGKRNRWFKKSHRGRKRCALNFDRHKAGLGAGWTFDPDVKSGRLAADRQITKIFYKRRPPVSKTSTHREVAAPSVSKDSEVSNIIGSDNTAWNIAGEDYDSPDTLYKLPGRGKRAIRGDRVSKEVGWDKLPAGTQVLVNHPLNQEKEKGPIFSLKKDYTAWSLAGSAYRRSTTIYILPRNKIVPGNLIRDWDALPSGTKLIIGYKGPFVIQNVEGKTAWGIARKAYNHSETIYLVPGEFLVTGDRVKDFNDLPRGTQVFLKINGIR